MGWTQQDEGSASEFEPLVFQGLFGIASNVIEPLTFNTSKGHNEGT